MAERRSRLDFRAMSQLARSADWAVPFTIRAVCRLGVPDLLSQTPRAWTEVAEACGAHAPSLLRALRTLVTRELCAEPTPGWFALTPLGMLLRSDHPRSLRGALPSDDEIAALARLAADCFNRRSTNEGDPMIEAQLNVSPPQDAAAGSKRRTRLRIEAIGALAQLADTTVPLAIRAACKLGVADHMSDTPRSVEELAAACQAHAPSLLRLLRALTTRGVFAEPKPECFALTEIGDLLRSDHRLSMRRAFRSRPDLDALSEMEYSVRTGQPAFDHIFGMEYFDYLSERPELVTEFQASQRALSRFEEVVILRSYDWSKCRYVVDIGGGDGAFISHLLAGQPHMRGTLFDLPNTVKGAPKMLADAGVTSRCEVIGASFMERALPEGADVYMIKRVCVGLDDAQLTTLFRSVRKAMRPDSRLLVLEPMMAEGDVSTAMDLLMLVLGPGRVRTPDEFNALLGGAGLKLSRVVSKRIIPFIEAEPV